MSLSPTIADGIQAYQAGQFEQSLSIFKTILQAEPINVDALNMASVLALQLARHEEAENFLRRLIEVHPDWSTAYNNLGVCLLRSGRYEAADACYEEAVRLDAGDAAARNNLRALRSKRQTGESEGQYTRRLLNLSLAGKIQKQEVYFLEAAAFERECGDIRAAVDCCRAAIEHGFRSVYAYTHLAYHYDLDGQTVLAEQAYQDALTADYKAFDTYRSYSAFLLRMKKYREAEAIARRGIALNGGNEKIWATLGSTLAQQCRPQEAVDCFRQAETLNGNDPLAYAGQLFNMNYLPQTTAQDIYEQAVKIGWTYESAVQPYTAWQHSVASGRPQKLSVGFVSADLRLHPVGHFFEAVAGEFCHERFTWQVFSATREFDAVSERISRAVDGWHTIVGQTDAQVAKFIHEMGVDVLIDLSGHTANSRIGLFAHRPAPVQISWLGWFATTGLTRMDYLLTDRVSVAGIEAYFSEKMLYLSDTRLCMARPTDEIAVTPLPALSNGYLTFGCIQNLAKITPEILRLWAEILAALPTAKLQLQSGQFSSEEMKTDFVHKAVAQGVNEAQLVLYPPSDRNTYLKTTAQADILLDTYPYTGGTTTVEALWMGVPTLTLSGDTMIARQGDSLLHAAGLSDWVARSPREYVAQAIGWAQHLDELAQLRAGLRAQVADSALFDAPRFARDFERALDTVWMQ